MEIKSTGKINKCMNPEIDCRNALEETTTFVVVYRGNPLVLCQQCGPQFQMKVIQDKQKQKMKQN